MSTPNHPPFVRRHTRGGSSSSERQSSRPTNDDGPPITMTARRALYALAALALLMGASAMTNHVQGV